MNIITEPTVAVISTTRFHPHSVYELPKHAIESENVIALAGKVCYDSYGLDGNPVTQHVTNLVSSGHLSVIEHVNVGLFIEGISRGCSHEIVRHRAGMSYSQRSTRYTKENDAAVVLEPYYAELFKRQDHLRSAAEQRLLNGFLLQARSALGAYEEQAHLLEDLAPAGLTRREARKWARGKARQTLPHWLETRMVMTGNLRAWRHFILLRSADGAEAEIRRLAMHVAEQVMILAPTVFSDLHCVEINGFPMWSE